MKTAEISSLVNKNLSIRNVIFGVIGIVVFLTMLFTASKPDEIGPLGITGVVFLIYICLALLILIYNLWRFQHDHDNQKLLTKSAIEAVVPLSLVALNTVGQLGAYDVIFIGLLFMLARFYTKRKLRIY